MQTGALIVAAGKSSRMGDFKPMLQLGSISIAQRVINNFRQAGISKVVVVTGYHADVLECHLMAGTADYLLKVVARDTEDFARIHRRYLARLPGVAQMHSSFALRIVRQTTAMPV